MSGVATTGYYSPSTTTGDGSPSATTGDWSPSATTGDGSPATTTGYYSPAFAAWSAAESAHDVAVGRWVRLHPDSSDALVLPDRSDYHPYLVSADDGWPVGAWITMRDGWVVACPDVLLPDDGRGYTLRFEDGHYRGGCRTFTYEQAVKHWSDPKHPRPDCAARLLAEVERHHAEVTK